MVGITCYHFELVRTSTSSLRLTMFHELDANIDYYFIHVQILTTKNAGQLQLMDAALADHLLFVFFFVTTSSNYFVMGIFNHVIIHPEYYLVIPFKTY